MVKEDKLKPGVYLFDDEDFTLVKDRSYYHWSKFQKELFYERTRPDAQGDLDKKLGPKCMAFW